MNRRDFIHLGTLGGIVTLGGAVGVRWAGGVGTKDLDLATHAATLQHLLFDEYLPFWERGGYDEERGGFMCYLHDDGSVQDDRKDVWYQGRGLWVYAFLYNHIDRNPKWLEIASRSRDFMVTHMHRGDGTWIDTVNRFGEPVATKTIRKSVERYAEFKIKTMWAQTEVLVGTLRAYAETGGAWALDWYTRTWEYVARTMTTEHGVWFQAVDRRGNPIDRPGISTHRKGNFHQPRCLMMNLLDVERLKAGRSTLPGNKE